ncbi:MAG: spondin domain-containing protein [Candidatus Competibacterales bacterium]|nr:spondin domain-containing protein [Candidatus Competibacterales bacterium]
MRLRDMGRLSLLATAAALLAACGGDDDDDGGTVSEPMRYEIRVTNLTAGQPLSPVLVALHDPALDLLEVGEPVSVELEQLAEGGDNEPLLAALQSSEGLVAVQGGSGPIGPGDSTTLMLEVTEDTPAPRLSVVTMLVNSNDALAVLDGATLDDLAIGAGLSYALDSYDAGTEANDESADAIPGPAAAGGGQVGFDPARDDVADRLSAHPGVVTADDGLTGSVLGDLQRWDNPVARVRVTRLQ